jgi:prepilin-type N-terminal cleavage/methylation domain-containing protein
MNGKKGESTMYLRTRKRKDSRGFTLMEMLIVVAIIAVLAAIAIPTLNANMEEAREAADSANMQNAKTVAAVGFVQSTYAAGDWNFDAENGTLVKTTLPAYGKGTATVGDDTESHTAEIIKVNIAANGAVTADWVTPAAIS